MKRNFIISFLIIAAILGIIGAAVSVGMVIRAVQWREWGRVVLYCVTTVVCVEMTVLAIVKLKDKETT